MRQAILLAIRIYQHTLSPDTGALRGLYLYGRCRYSPTCSMYTYQAVERFGVRRGLLLGVKRLSRCHPWHRGGDDPLKLPAS